MRTLQAIPARYRIPVLIAALAAWLLVVVGVPLFFGLRGWDLLLMSALGAIALAISFIPFNEE